MTDLDQLEKDIETYHWVDVASEELLRELVLGFRQSKKDAERYRLRLETVRCLFGTSVPSDEELDIAIEAADRNSRDSDTPNT